MRQLFWQWVRILNGHVFVRILCVTMGTSILLLLVTVGVINRKVSEVLREYAVEDGGESIEVVQEYFVDLYEEIKLINLQIYSEKEIQNHIRTFLQKGEKNSPDDKRYLREILMKQFEQSGNKKELIGMNYYDIATRSIIPIFTKETTNRNEYLEKTIKDALLNLQNDPVSQRVNECIFLEDKTGEMTISLYDYVRNPDNLSEIVGFLIVHYSGTRIKEELYQQGISDEMEILLINRQNELCFSYQKMEEEYDIEEMQLKPGMYTEKGVRFVQYNSRFGFYVVASISEKVLYSTVKEINLFMYKCILIVTILVTMIFKWYSKRVGFRMKQLVEGVEQIEAGSFNVVLPESHHQDEIDLLSRSINDMQRRLSAQLEQEKKNQERIHRAEVLQKDAELYALQAQIKPHFLYNTLEVIRMTAMEEHASNVATMIRLLADVFRENVKRSTMRTIGEEVDYCEKYLELFSYRFKEGLNSKFYLAPGVSKYMIPTYVLQPIVENALIHGLNQEEDDQRLDICIQMDGERICILISDNGKGLDREQLRILQEKIKNSDIKQEGIGLININQRLKILFGGEYGISVGNASERGLVVTVRIPAVIGSDRSEYV